MSAESVRLPLAEYLFLGPECNETDGRKGRHQLRGRGHAPQDRSEAMELG